MFIRISQIVRPPSHETTARLTLYVEEEAKIRERLRKRKKNVYTYAYTQTYRANLKIFAILFRGGFHI